MRTGTLLVFVTLFLTPGISRPAPANPFDQLKTLAGEWEADLPGFGN